MCDPYEILGRLFLWHESVYQTRSLLILASRTKRGIIQENIVAEDQNFKTAYTESRGFPSDIQLESDKNIMIEHRYVRPFPILEECQQIYDACVSLAVIYFCQIYTTGNQSNGTVANNNKYFKNTHLELLLNNIFPNPNDKSIYDDFVKNLLIARDKMIAHADGSAFDISHSKNSMSMKLHKSAIIGINIDYWLSFLLPLELELSRYYLMSKSEITNT